MPGERTPYRIQPIPQIAVTEEVVNQIRNLILSGTLEEGEKLPSEPDLSESLGVSRATLREALRTLTAVGLLERDRRGTFVSVSGPKNLLQTLTYHSLARKARLTDLLEARLMLEVGMADLAAGRATEDNVKRLQEALSDMKRFVDDDGSFIEADASFHLLLTESVQNTVLSTLLIVIRDLLIDYIRSAVSTDPGIRDRAVVYHERIVGAISRGDGSEARRAMKEHLEDTFAVIRSGEE